MIMYNNDNNSFRYRTIIHGDVKNENIFFSKDKTKCALFDFQYIGRGDYL